MDSGKGGRGPFSLLSQYTCVMRLAIRWFISYDQRDQSDSEAKFTRLRETASNGIENRPSRV